MLVSALSSPPSFSQFLLTAQSVVLPVIFRRPFTIRFVAGLIHRTANLSHAQGPHELLEMDQALGLQGFDDLSSGHDIQARVAYIGGKVGGIRKRVVLWLGEVRGGVGVKGHGVSAQATSGLLSGWLVGCCGRGMRHAGHRDHDIHPA